MITWTLLIIYATTNTPQLGMVGSGLSGIGATSIPGFTSEKTCLEAKEKVLSPSNNDASVKQDAV